MSSPVITVENLSKVYTISHQGTRPDTFRDTISGVFNKLTTRNSQPATEVREDFYALRDVSFEVNQGEVLGIIGRNGAGKSTLLKILSRITEPTSGRVEIRGRVASLLEVGTGFHPELTGRENIFLNGAILGMSRAEIRQKFDEIVEFSGVNKFLDTPVKRYSSGMYVRLAFAVAAHLEPEILIIDEVLAVGDLEFQDRCFGKMESVSRSGKTVFFVSHNLAAIEKLTARALYLDKGRVVEISDSHSVVDSYRKQFSRAVVARGGVQEDIIANSQMEITGIELTPDPTVVLGKLSLGILFKSHQKDNEKYSVFYALTDNIGQYVASSYSRDEGISYVFGSDETLSVEAKLPFHTLLPGEYCVEAGLFNAAGSCVYWARSTKYVRVDRDMFNGRPFDNRGGFSTWRSTWSHAKPETESS